MKFNILDGIILAVVAFGVWRGFAAGLIRELSQLFGLFVAFALALQLMKPVGALMVTVVNVVDLPIGGAALVGFVVIFVLVYVTVYLTARFLERVAHGIKLGPINRFFGGAFGVGKAVLALSIIFVFFGQLGIPEEDFHKGSYLYGSVEQIAPEAWEVFTQSVPTATKMTRTVGERFWEQPEGATPTKPSESELQRKVNK